MMYYLRLLRFVCTGSVSMLTRSPLGGSFDGDGAVSAAEPPSETLGRSFAMLHIRKDALRVRELARASFSFFRRSLALFASA